MIIYMTDSTKLELNVIEMEETDSFIKITDKELYYSINKDKIKYITQEYKRISVNDAIDEVIKKTKVRI